MYNIATHSYADNPPLITISFEVCHKCSKSRLIFIFGNEMDQK